MSSAVVSTSAAFGRPFVFEDELQAESCSLSSSHYCHSSIQKLMWGQPPSAVRPSEARQGEEGPLLARVLRSTIKNQPAKIPSAGITPASHLNIRPAPEMASSGIPEIDALTGGLPRGCLTEICGLASSGRTTLLLAALAAATRRGEYCVLVDASDALDPHSVAAAGVELDRLLWVRCGDSSPSTNNSPQRHRDTEKSRNEENRGCPILVPRSLRNRACPEEAKRVEGVGISARSEIRKEDSRASEHRLEQLLRATDMLLESSGFGLIALDLCDLPLQAARRIPLTTWFRYRRAVEHTPTVLLALEQHPIAGSCSSLLLRLGSTDDKLAERASQESLLSARNPSRGNARKKYILDETLKRTQPDSSREAAACESPARQCRVAVEMWEESRRDDTSPDSHNGRQISYLAHTQLLTKLEIRAEVERSRLERKPSRSTSIAFTAKTAWAG